jgi:hypothetical protein
MDVKLVNELPEQYKSANKQKPDVPLNANAIPDIEQLLDTILAFLNYINDDTMQEFEITDNVGFEQHMNAKFEAFANKHYSIFKLLLDRENRAPNIAKLFDMLTTLKKVKTGRLDINKADKDFQENLNTEFVYPTFGSKEEFEKQLQKANAEKKSEKSGKSGKRI